MVHTAATMQKSAAVVSVILSKTATALTVLSRHAFDDERLHYHPRRDKEQHNRHRGGTCCHCYRRSALYVS